MPNAVSTFVVECLSSVRSRVSSAASLNNDRGSRVIFNKANATRNAKASPALESFTVGGAALLCTYCREPCSIPIAAASVARVKSSLGPMFPRAFSCVAEGIPVIGSVEFFFLPCHGPLLLSKDESVWLRNRFWGRATLQGQDFRSAVERRAWIVEEWEYHLAIIRSTQVQLHFFFKGTVHCRTSSAGHEFSNPPPARA